MKINVHKLLQRLQDLEDQGYGRAMVVIDKVSFRHNCESDGVTCISVAGVGMQEVYVADEDGGIMTNKDGTERTKTMCVLVGDLRANHKGELIRREH